MKTLYSKACLAVVSGLITGHASAQQPIETISVIGARVPVEQSQLSSALTQIDRAEIEASGAISVADLLRGQAGISLSQSGAKGSVTQIRMRGSEANHVLVMVDGVEINDLSDGGVDFAHLQLNNIARIEILRGPQSALWGSGAVGGVISITTLQSDAPLSGHLKLEAGEAKSTHLAASLSGKQGGINYSLQASDYRSDGENVARHGNEKDGYKNKQFSTRLGWQLSPASRIDLNLRQVNASSDYDETDYAVTGLPQDTHHYTEVEQYQGKLNWRYEPAGTGWQQELGLQLNHNDNQNFNDGAYTNANQSETLRLYWQGSYEYRPESHLSFLGERVEKDFEQQDPSGFSNQDRSNNTNTVGIDWLHQLAQQWAVSASARHDNNNFFDNAQSYQAGISFRPVDGYKLYVSAGKAIKNPTFVELFGYFPGSFSGNPDLQAEHSVSVELGADVTLSQQWQLSTSVYKARLKDEIASNADFTSSINLSDDSERRGAELSLQGLWQQLQLTASYNYLDSRQPDFAGRLKPELRRARHSGHVSATYAFNSLPLQLYVKASYQGTQLDTNFLTFSTVKLPAYTLMDMTLSYELNHQWQLRLKAENLFNTTHEDVLGFVGQQQRFWLSANYRL